MSIRFIICDKIFGINNLNGQKFSLILSSRVFSKHSLRVSGSKMRNNARTVVAYAEDAHLKANRRRKKVCQGQDIQGPSLLSSARTQLLMFSTSLIVAPRDLASIYESLVGHFISKP